MISDEEMTDETWVIGRIQASQSMDRLEFLGRLIREESEGFDKRSLDRIRKEWLKARSRLQDEEKKAVSRSEA